MNQITVVKTSRKFKKKILSFLLFVMIGLSVYFIFFGSEIIIGAALLILSGFLDFKVMQAKRNFSK